MKKIHKKVIALKARAVTKALRTFKPNAQHKNKHNHRDPEAKELIGNNNFVFKQAYDKILGMKDSKKAKFMDIVLASADYGHYKHCKWHWAMWYHATCFYMKCIGTEYAFGIKMTHDLASVKRVAQWIKAGKTHYPYVLDDGPLNLYQIEEIRSASKVTYLPDESFEQSLL